MKIVRAMMLVAGSVCPGGTCKIISECSAAGSFENGTIIVCSYDGKIPVVCCPLVPIASNKNNISFRSAVQKAIIFNTPLRFASTTSSPVVYSRQSNSHFGHELVGIKFKHLESASCKGGRCLLVNECKTIRDIKKLRPDICGFEGKIPIICCPNLPQINLTDSQFISSVSASINNSKPNSIILSSVTTPSTIREQSSIDIEGEDENVTEFNKENIDQPGMKAMRQCHNYHKLLCQSDKYVRVVMGGTKSKSRDLKFMVILGYGEKDKQEWDCGGSVISEKWVLSAAHCNFHSRLGKAKWIKLGDLDIVSDTDDASPIVISIVRTVIHPNYLLNGSLYNDIVLFMTKHDIIFNKFIQPICLDATPLNYRSDVVAAGWGTTEFGGPTSAALLQVNLTLITSNKCNQIYNISRLLPRGLDVEKQICAGTPGKDTCSGDSGGPLFRQNLSISCMRIQLGITSFGKKCGIHPGVYTWVQPYLGWIESIVWPEDDQPITTTPKLYFF